MPAPATRVVTAGGPRAAEELLLEALEQDQREVRADLARLARPLYVLVPSKSLRLALEERIASRFDRPALGIQVLTLRRFARLVHERAGASWPKGEELLPVLARRLAPSHAELASLGTSRDGLLALEAALRDLQHAGFVPELVEALAECLEDGARDSARARARALLDLACALDAALRESGCARQGAWANSAAELLRGAEGLHAARALWIHGFQDAPGTTSELLATLVDRAGAQLVFDTTAISLPPGPTGTRYGEPLADRLGVPRPAQRSQLTTPGVVLEFVRAIGLRAEARAAASAVRERIAAGVKPERIAIVARSLQGIAGELAAALRILGIPHSGLGAEGSPDPAARGAHALADVLQDGTRAYVVRALRAGWRIPESLGTTEHELLAACGLLGATRLQSLAALDLEGALSGSDGLRLPGGRGAARSPRDPLAEESEEIESEEEERTEPGHDNRRSVSRDALEWVRTRAAQWNRALEALPARAELGRLAREFERFALEHFPERGETLRAAMQGLCEALPPELTLARAEFLERIADHLRQVSTPPLGGGGSGVQVLDALEARSRTFDELFLVDLRQGSFPRSVHEEPLLPDRLRLRLSSVLPDLPVKTAALAEEEALFAGLIASAPRVTLSWTTADEDGKREAPSPFLRRAWRESLGEGTPLEAARLASFAPARRGDPARVPLERGEIELIAQLARNGRAAFAKALPGVLAAHGRERSKVEALARTRLAVLEELEPGRKRAAYPNAFLGSLGALRHAEDARRKTPWVSDLEALAACPWQMLLGRVLEIAPPVPVRDLGAVLEPAHVGSVVHAVLAVIVRGRAGRWPDEAGLRELTAGAAVDVVRRERLAPAGIARLLELRAHGFLEVARRHDAELQAGARAEIQGVLRVSKSRELPFRADRVEIADAGERWIDFKTSKVPLTINKTEKGRSDALHKAIREGRALQAAAYAVAAGPAAIGSYVYLHPRIDDAQRVLEARAADPEIEKTLRGALETLYAALDEGAFPPRLVHTDLRSEHKGCARCDFQAACLRGDSGMRLRTASWLREDAAQARETGFLGAVQGLWRLKRPQPEAGDA